MARKFHRKDRLSALTEINVTPLIDLAFALLIIFMITTPLLEQTIKVNLPVEAVKSQADEREDFQAISINEAGLYYWGDEQVSEQQLGHGPRASGAEHPRRLEFTVSEGDYGDRYDQAAEAV
jgi:biopolymer transport protein ExbD